MQAEAGYIKQGQTVRKLQIATFLGTPGLFGGLLNFIENWKDKRCIMLMEWNIYRVG